jgi:surface protein
MTPIAFGFFSDQSFVSTWKTDNAGTSGGTQITIPTSVTGTYSCTVDWGDGKTNFISTYNDSAWTHTYSIAGTYTVKIYGKFVGIYFNNGGDRLKLINISKWGYQFRLGTNQGNYFYGCSNLTITATDILNTKGTTALNDIFRGCSSIATIPNIGKWNIESVITIADAFNGCSLFNSSLSGWNTANVTSMVATFKECTVFNQSVSNFNTALVTAMKSMFFDCAAFNQPVDNFNTSTVTTFQTMFTGCTAFNQDVSTFSITSLTNAASMFFNSGFSKTNYNKLLDSVTGWPSQATVQSNVTLGAGTAHYDGANAIAGRAYLTGTKTWTITDGGTP